MSDAGSNKAKRTSLRLGPDALRNLQTAAARRGSQREAVEEALRLLVEKDAQRDAMDEFVEHALAEWGEPTEAEKARAAEILSSS